MQKVLLTTLFAVVGLAGCGGSDTLPSYLMESKNVSRWQMPAEQLDQQEGLEPLKRCILTALTNSSEFAAENWLMVSAQAQRNTAAGKRLPKIEAVGGYSHYIDPQQSLLDQQYEDPALYTESIFAGDLVLSMPVFTGGRISNLVSAAELEALAAKRQKNRERAKLVYRVSKGFYKILSLREQAAIVSESIHSLEENKSDIRSRIFSGEADESDRLQVETQLSEFQRHLESIRTELALQKEEMTLLLGLSEEGSAEELEALVQGELEFEPVDATVDDYLNQAFNRRSDYVAARATVEAHNRRVDAAKGGRWPEISLKMSYGDRWAEDFSDLNSPVESENAGRAGVAFSLPLFEGGQTDSKIREARARLFAAWEKLHHRRKEIRLEVKSAVVKLESAARRYRLTDQALTKAKENLRLLRNRYRAGKAGVESLITAHTAYLSARLAHLEALTDHILAAEELDYAVGKKD